MGLFGAGVRVRRGAEISPCGTYRFLLWRQWAETEDTPECVFIMLNPSTADALTDDPTIRRCVDFARREGCGRLAVVNLFALRSTDPAGLRRHPDPVGPHNDEWILGTAAGGLTVAAWGAGGVLAGRAEDVTNMLLDNNVRLKCLGVTKDGHPRHPLYVRGDAPLADYP